jgi:hypothetical protein
MNPWLVGGGALALLLLSTRKAEAALVDSGGDDVDRDLDALADMLITETGFSADKAEMAAIVNIAVNRARAQKRPIWYVVQPGKRPVGSCPWTKDARCLMWNDGDVYEKRFKNARSNARWGAARVFAATVLAGNYVNTGATSFVHPGHANFDMPCKDNKPVREGKWAPANVPGYGTRCIPKWAHGGKVIGKGLFA